MAPIYRVSTTGTEPRIQPYPIKESEVTYAILQLCEWAKTTKGAIFFNGIAYVASTLEDFVARAHDEDDSIDLDIVLKHLRRPLETALKSKMY